jgi:predicted transcriptional regulator
MSEDSADDGGAGTDRDRVGRGRKRAVAEFDERVVELLSWALDTETRARIYVYLREHPWSTSEEVAEGTGLYPSTVREALASLAEEETVQRRKRENEGAGNNPYEYTAVAPSELVSDVVGQVQDQLNALCNLDALDDDGADGDPVTIEVKAEGGDGDDAAEDAAEDAEDKR